MRKLLSVIVLLVMSVTMLMAQTRVVTGRVLSSEDGEPIIGATVMVPGTQTGTVTDIDGNFSLRVPNNEKALNVSYVGMESQLVNISKSNKAIIVTLSSSDELLDEVMVVAYGKAKRSAFTGSAAEIKSSDISAHVTSTATNSLAGKVAGVTMTSTSGEPGSAPTIRIRGVGSLNAKQTPLYIVDGAPYEAGIANINPADIESISVQKDASAAAIYGARGANGVVIITTKKAKDGDAKVTFDARFGSNSPLLGRYDVIKNPGEYYEAHYKAMFNSKYYHGATLGEAYNFADNNLLNENNGGLGYQVYTLPEGEKLIGNNFKLNPHAKLGYSDGEFFYTPDDWYDETIHNSFRQEYNANIAGSNNRLNYFMSVGYLDDGGMVNNSRYQRYTGRANVDYQVKKWMKVFSNLSFTHANSQSPSYSATTWGSSGNVFYITKDIAPIYPLYVRNADGSIKMESGRKVYDISTNTNQHRAAIVGNAVRDNEYNRDQVWRDIFSGTFGTEITPVEGLTLNATIAATSNNYRNNSLYSAFGSSSSVDGAVYVASNRYYSVNQTYTANYTKTIGENHNLGALLGYEQYQMREYYLNGYNDHLYDPFVGELNNAYGIDNKDVSSSAEYYMTEGFFGRLTYDYAEKYFVSGTYRRDASSVFAPGHRWGNFGSVGLAWQLNKESFMESAYWVDLLKLKASWGANGNDGLDNWYAYADQYTVSWNPNSGYGTTMYQKGKEDITWESNSAWNFGVDFALFKNRLSGSLEYFTRTTGDMLFYKYVPASSGLSVSGYYDNIGEMVNKGIEFTLDGTIIKNRKLTWDANFNLTHYTNKITKLEDELILTGRILKQGGSAYQAYMYQYAGVDPETGEAQYWGDVMYDSDNKVTTDATKAVRTEKEMVKSVDKATQYDCGTTLPDLVGGFGTSLSAYGFDLSAQFSYQLGGKFYDGTYQQQMHNGQSAGEVMHRDLLNAWSEENPNSNIPRLSTAAADDGLLTQTQNNLDFFLTDASYLCLNNLTLGYTLPMGLTKQLGLANLRVYVAGENLFLLTKRQGMDPRYNMGIGGMTLGSGLAGGSYSALRSVTCGLSVTF